MPRAIWLLWFALFPAAAPARPPADELKPIREAIRVKDFELAETLADRALLAHGVKARFLLAVAKKGLKKLDEAALQFARAARDPDADDRIRSRALWNHALVQMARRDWKAAINVWELYLEFARTRPAESKRVPLAKKELAAARAELAKAKPIPATAE
jgi:hypothetical protein